MSKSECQKYLGSLSIPDKLCYLVWVKYSLFPPAPHLIYNML